MWLKPKLLLLIAFILLGVGVLSCDRPDVATPTPPTVTPSPTPLNPRALLEKSGKIMESLESFHFLIEHRSGGTPLMPGLLITDAEGDVVKPDRLTAEFGGQFGTLYIQSSFIALGDVSYMTNPLTGQWETIPAEVSPLGFFSPRRGISAIMTQVSGVSIVSSDERSYRLAGKLPPQALSSLVGETISDTSAAAMVSVELTIDADEFHLLEAVLDGRVTASEPDGTVRVIALSQFNEPFDIEPPF